MINYAASRKKRPALYSVVDARGAIKNRTNLVEEDIIEKIRQRNNLKTNPDDNSPSRIKHQTVSIPDKFEEITLPIETLQEMRLKQRKNDTISAVLAILVLMFAFSSVIYM